MDPCSDTVPDLTADTMFCKPTNTNEVEEVKHYNFQEKIDCPVFTNKFMEPVPDRFKRRKKKMAAISERPLVLQTNKRAI